ncbi:MAG TPA: selenide, water dikinase SelD [Leptospiraceae bacterium]|nr:selenide, water dikinase SelD [Leptospiraceae bacterium]HMW04944.1 selenide, water dikinase SelD [Leptospiraceae bacterium]HMX31907.1 selenide, water dikinase SelD [Leptospiraceae bacterium]HMY30835.1 selenide, water dikinase SelD [Leptospiraceae bacterium]HMZ64296.1 selenide, water dikinase SelD [Leptospiraceae bacterium]
MKNLVLVGGGQSHAPVLRKLGMEKNDLRITLISANSIVPYSGMLPGYIAGKYKAEECLIDLRHLCNFSGARFVNANVVGLDLDKKHVLLENRPPIPYEILSMNIGIVPNIGDISGREYITPIKPALPFLEKWISILKKIEKGDFKNGFRLAILGAGAGGIETALTARERIMKIIPDFEIHIFQRGREILNGHNQRVKDKVIKILNQKGIILHLNEEFRKISNKGKYFECLSGKGNIYNLDFIIGAMSPKPADWILDSGLMKDENGFILVNDYLESISHPNVFAVGDIASMKNYSRPKAGVFAVRQSEPLFKNIINLSKGKKLIKYKPQKNFLTLLNIGDGTAIASRGKYALGASEWIWSWKDSIDQDFMEKFQSLPYKMTDMTQSESQDSLVCKGCDSKAGSEIIKYALDNIEKYQMTLEQNRKEKKKLKTLVGLKEREDSSVIEVSKKMNLIQSVDFFQPIISDYYLAGQITANHCLNDLYSKGVNGHCAHAIINAEAGVEKSEEDVFQILAGAISVFNREGVELLGGHTGLARNFEVGFICSGFSDTPKFYSKKNAKEGDAIVITKPIGTGLIFAADMQNKANPFFIDAAIQFMLQSNFHLVEVLRKYKIGACTDVTGFGLAGHLYEIMKASNLKARINLNKIPLVRGVEEILKKHPEIQSNLYPSNWKSFSPYISFTEESIVYRILFDPQTAGGFLFTLPESNVKNCLHDLESFGYTASIIGEIVKDRSPLEKFIECFLE